MHGIADIFYLALAVLFAILTVQAALGLLPRARPRFWPFRVTGYKDVRLSKFSLISVVCTNFAVAAAFSGAAFSTEILGLIGLFVSIVSFGLIDISRTRDIRRFQLQRLAALKA